MVKNIFSKEYYYHPEQGVNKEIPNGFRKWVGNNLDGESKSITIYGAVDWLKSGYSLWVCYSRKYYRIDISDKYIKTKFSNRKKVIEDMESYGLTNKSSDDWIYEYEYYDEKTGEKELKWEVNFGDDSDYEVWSKNDKGKWVKETSETKEETDDGDDSEEETDDGDDSEEETDDGDDSEEETDDGDDSEEETDGDD